MIAETELARCGKFNLPNFLQMKLEIKKDGNSPDKTKEKAKMKAFAKEMGVQTEHVKIKSVTVTVKKKFRLSAAQVIHAPPKIVLPDDLAQSSNGTPSTSAASSSVGDSSGFSTPSGGSGAASSASPGS
eukprot:8561638-Pyramimonas_sp.AAC.1